MSLFQNNVAKKYTNTLDKKKLDEKWQLFTAIFHNTAKQDNIRNSKEEQYQEGFLRDLFVQILGYTLNPDAHYNLISEQKNETNSKKADGAIILNENVHAVIELKGTETTDLSKIENQAFGYKNNQKNCSYVIISNFEKLRFYIDNATEHIEFNLFTLSRDEFDLLYTCLSLESMQSDLPKKIKNESVSNEDKITKELYKDYSAFRKELFADIEQLNPQYDRLLLFKKTQKLLDRFLFIFFAEDRQLLPTNLIFSINLEWQNLRQARIMVSLYDRYKMYFQDLNTGARVSLPVFGKQTNEIVTAQYDIYAYNGGLFQPDDVLDTIAITDDLLFKHTKKLSDYDFESEVDVNILGHIFENSLNEIDEITNAIDGQEVDKTKTKRKKDGVFYTPKYITKYIVDNTLGKLCEEKKTELALDETKYTTDKRITVATKKKLIETLDQYRKWLLQLTIVDPACGSGAFLNQALEFLIAEHRYVDELQAKLFGDALVLSDVEGSILENNLFGVDLNEESVEIAKLSLWLRTAQRNRKLNSLNNNIKCGNSLIDDATIAGDKAFNWHNEFPQVFEKGGFDVVIGNPPYLRVQGIKENHLNQSLFFESNYKSAIGRYDLYILFIEKAFNLINKKGRVSLILPYNFINGNLGEGIRKYLLDNNSVEEILHFGSNKVFSDASTYTCIIGLSLNNNFIKYASINPKNIFNDIDFQNIDYKKLSIEKWDLNSSSNQKIIDKLNKYKLTLNEYFSQIARGVVTGADNIFILKGKIEGDTFKGFSKELNTEIEIESNLVKPILMGNSISRYSPLLNESYLLYPHIKKQEKTEPIAEDDFAKLFPKGYNYLLNFKEILTEKKIKYKTNTDFWYSLHNSRNINIFETKKIITPYLSFKSQMSFDLDEKFYTNDKCSCLILKNEKLYSYKFFLPILNSNLFWFFIKQTSSEFSGGYFAYTNLFLNSFPVPKISLTDQQPFIEKADLMLSLNKSLQEVSSKFTKYFSGQFKIEKLSGKLEKWYELSFEEFIKEINKAIKAQKGVPLTKKNEFDWIDLFEENKAKANALQTQIATTDKAIDAMVYELYGLSEEEIKIVENS